jgi:hypothetical protein
MPRWFWIVAASALIVMCSFALMAEPAKVLKIAVTTDGRVTADGRPVSIDALRPILRDLAKSKGEIWYYREAAQAEPHPYAMRVLSAIVEHNLPISFSTKPDYSDVVDDKGRSAPRR